MKKRIQIQLTLIFLAGIALVLLHRYLFPLERSETLEIIGVIMVLAGYLLRISARGTKAELNPDGKTLIVQGPYALTRNPMYLGTLLIGLGIILVLLRWWVGVIFLLIYLAIYIPQINREEKTLASRFGDTFKQYCRVTPKFIPRFIKLLRTKPGDYLKIKSGWLKKELRSLILLLLFMAAIKIWQDLKH
jgi:protein-S-isoprenylcysteine O-methyltransferase Ste14